MGNPILFLVDCVAQVAAVLSNYLFWGVDLLTWFFGFIVVGMVVSCFWRGARG